MPIPGTIPPTERPSESLKTGGERPPILKVGDQARVEHQGKVEAGWRVARYAEVIVVQKHDPATDQEIRKTVPPEARADTLLSPDQDIQTGRFVSVRRSSGATEDDWLVRDRGAYAFVNRPDPGRPGELEGKWVPRRELMDLNWTRRSEASWRATAWAEVTTGKRPDPTGPEVEGRSGDKLLTAGEFYQRARSWVRRMGPDSKDLRTVIQRYSSEPLS